MFPLLELSGFSDMSEEEQLATLQVLVDTLTRINLIWLRSHTAPPLYKLAPRYAIKPRPFAIDSWQDMATTIARRTGDCKDFAAYRCAELTARGIQARIHPFKVGEIYHFTVIANGVEEDPSERLGMKDTFDLALGTSG